jgi:hypothetical protein
MVLRQQRGAETPVAPVVIERALVQVMLADEGYQNYRARFLFTRLGARTLDLEMPAPLSGLNLEAMLDGKKLTQIQTVDSSGKVVDNGTILRLALEPDLYTRPVLLDLRYQLAPARTRSKGVFHTTLAAPEPHGEVFVGRVRWQVVLPQGWLAFHLGGGYQAEQRWEWHGGLLSPRPWVSGADLERWLGAAPIADDVPADDVTPGLVCSRSDLAPFSIVQMPQQGWLLLCSLLFLAVGLGLAFASMPRAVFWGIVIALGVGAVYLSITVPSLMPALAYGCEPGAVVLILIFAVGWLLQQHYRRQVVFLPGFTRVKTAVPAAAREGATHARREPSTIDAPLKRESSLS